MYIRMRAQTHTHKHFLGRGRQETALGLEGQFVMGPVCGCHGNRCVRYQGSPLVPVKLQQPTLAAAQHSSPLKRVETCPSNTHTQTHTHTRDIIDSAEEAHSKKKNLQNLP